MKMFSLNWFKSEKQKELDVLEVEMAKLKIKSLEQEIHSKEPASKPYKKVKLVNDVLTIVLSDGSILSKPNAKESDFQRVRDCQNEFEILSIVSSIEGLLQKKKVEEENQKVTKTIEGFDLLKSLDDFEVENGSVYMKANGKVIKRSLPSLLIDKLALEVLNSDKTAYDSLKKFWLKCCLNPNAQSAEDLYLFLENHQFKIDKHGNFYAYRNVRSLGEDNKELVEFVSNTYTKVKGVWKKKPLDFDVYKEENKYYITKHTDLPNKLNDENEYIGNLEHLYLDLPNMQEESYTDAHTGTMNYKIGEIASIARDEGDDNNSVSCSKGLHIASKAYDYSGFGDTSVLAIVNPMDVLAVPKNEVGKLRTCRWFFASVLDNDERHILDDGEFEVSELGDIFEEKCLLDLEEYIKEGFSEEVKRHTFTLSSMNSSEMLEIVKTLEEMNYSISNRIVNL